MLRRLAGLLAALAFAGLLVVVADLVDPPHPLTGVVRIVDGDSLEIGGARVRLLGIDAPELQQTCRRDGTEYPCGRIARTRLAALVGGAAPECLSRRLDRWGRHLATCRVGGTDLAAALVAEGWAVSETHYAAEERTARSARLGMWAGAFDDPADWRRAHLRADGVGLE